MEPQKKERVGLDQTGWIVLAVGACVVAVLFVWAVMAPAPRPAMPPPDVTRGDSGVAILPAPIARPPVDTASAAATTSPTDTPTAAAAVPAEAGWESIDTPVVGLVNPRSEVDEWRAEALRDREASRRRDSILLAVLEQHSRADSARAAERARDQQAMRDSLRESLDSAGIAFNAPDRMRRGESVGIHLVVDPAAGPADSMIVKARVTEPTGERRYDRVPVGPQAEARLTGARFEIKPVNLPRQAIGRTAPTEWRWIVTPLEGGKHKLYLSLDAFSSYDFASPIYSATKTYEIEVEVSTMGRFLGWLNGQLAWIIPLLLSAPVFAFLRRLWRRKAASPAAPVVSSGVPPGIPISPVTLSEGAEMVEVGGGEGKDPVSGET